MTQPDDEYWKAYRARARRRASSLGAVVICPFGIALAALKILEPAAYPAGDVRNEVLFRIALYGGLILVLGLAMFFAVRWLLADRRRPGA